MKANHYQIAQLSFTQSGATYCFIELLLLRQSQALDLPALMDHFSEYVTQFDEKDAIHTILNHYEKDEIDMQVLELLPECELQEAIVKKHDFIAKADPSYKLLNQILSVSDEKSLLTKRLTLEVVDYYKSHQDEYPDLSVKSLSKLRKQTVVLMLKGCEIKQAMDEVFDNL